VEDMDFCLFSSDNDKRNDDNGDLDGTERSLYDRYHQLHAVRMLQDVSVRADCGVLYDVV
tara:strand:- start:406 stop:585 length:180 start_codon:yes stop_codon:yes gene_type:complete